MVVCTSEGGPLETPLAEAGIPVHVLGFRGFTKKPSQAAQRLLHGAGTLRRFSSLLRSAGADIIHAFLPEAVVLGSAAGVLARTRVVVVSKRALCNYKKLHPLYAALENFANLAADSITVNSRAVGEDVRRTERFVGNKVTLIYNGVSSESPPAVSPASLSAALAGREDGPVVTYVANFQSYKGHADLVDAAAIVAREIPEVLFLLVGRNAGTMPAVREKVSRLRLENNVFLAGPRADAAGILASSVLAVHPSHEEGFSNVILEAMAAGLPVVAARVGGNPESVADGETGLLFPPGDAAAMAAGILALLRDPGRARRMGEAGRMRVLERFSVENMVAGVERLYESLLGRKA